MARLMLPPQAEPMTPPVTTACTAERPTDTTVRHSDTAVHHRDAAGRHGDTAPTLVLGGTGKTGRRVVQRLHARGVPARIGCRSADPAFDWQDRSTWVQAVTGVDSVYLCFAPDLAVPGAGDTVTALAALAAERGARRLVLLSGRGEPDAQAAEQSVTAAAAAAGADCTVVRASWFAQNFSEDYLLDAVLAGVLELPVGAVGEPFVDADDVAEVAVAALLDEEGRHAGATYEVTGPRLLTFADAAAEIAAATGRPLRFTSVTAEHYAAVLAEHQVPGDTAALLGYLFVEVLDGRNAWLADGVTRALGRPARDFAAFARAAADSGTWRPQ